MTTETVYYSPGAAAAIKNVTRANFNIWVANAQQAPDALMSSGTKDRKPTPAWTAQTLENWGHTPIENPETFYASQGAARYLGVPYPTFNHYRRTRQEIPADAWLQRSLDTAAKPVWKPATLKTWLSEVQAMVAAPHQAQALGVYGMADAAGLMNLTVTKFGELLEEHPLTPEAVILQPVTEKAWTGPTLSTWAHHAGVGIKRRKPTPVQVYPHSEAAKLLQTPRGELDKALHTHPLAPDALTVTPAEQAWREDTLRTWATQALTGKAETK